jgi:hypothetical protein
MNETETEPLIACLNFCRIDPESGYCLTCGRPPIPVSGIGLSLSSLDRTTLSAKNPTASKVEIPDET